MLDQRANIRALTFTRAVIRSQIQEAADVFSGSARDMYQMFDFEIASKDGNTELKLNEREGREHEGPNVGIAKWTRIQEE